MQENAVNKKKIYSTNKMAEVATNIDKGDFSSYIHNTSFSLPIFTAALFKSSIDLYRGEKLMGHPTASSCITFALLFLSKE